MPGLLDDPAVAFEAWWNAVMGDRMRHSKYLARNAWKRAIEWKRDEIRATLTKAINTLGPQGLREYVQMLVDGRSTDKGA